MKPNIFTSNGRLRCAWRIIVQFIAFLAVLMLVQSIQDYALLQNSALIYALGSAAYLLCIAGMTLVFARLIDRRDWRDFGFRFRREWFLDLIAGMLIGVLSLCIVSGTQAALGWMTFRLTPTTVFADGVGVAAAVALLTLFAIAAGEEFTFRAYQVGNLSEGLGGGRRAVLPALLVSSVLFGGIHLLNPNISLMGWINVCLAGLMLGLGYVLSGDLALPLGLHFAWGFFEEFVFGFANSGQTPLSSLFVNDGVGPVLWSGGSFGPEAGLIVTAVLVMDVILIVLWLKNRRRWKGIGGSFLAT